MHTDPSVEKRAAQLDRLAMRYETSVLALPSNDYLGAFYDFFEIKSREQACVPVREGFHGALREVSGSDVWQPIAEETERLFGLPVRVTALADLDSLRDEMDGPEGLGPFFFLFDLMFCEYEGFTLCFLSGTNN
jgi:hypothetical protein